MFSVTPKKKYSTNILFLSINQNVLHSTTSKSFVANKDKDRVTKQAVQIKHSNGSVHVKASQSLDICLNCRLLFKKSNVN